MSVSMSLELSTLLIVKVLLLNLSYLEAFRQLLVDTSSQQIHPILKLNSVW